ncbi:MAG TPA: hypothetical protein P5096_00375 [Patescibacteria group bacterium]|nr:hypothetical protein [Patescibacteria group bacterium]
MKKVNKLKRFLEIFPGSVAWLILLCPFIFGFWLPRWLAYFIIAFDFYWLVKAFAMSGYLLASHFHMKRDGKIDWFERCKKLEDLEGYIVEKTEEMFRSRFLNRRKNKEELQELIALNEMPDSYKKKWKDIYHVVMLPHLKDEFRILQSAIKSIADANFPTDKTIIVIGLEEREEGNEKFERAEKAIKEFKKDFYDIFYTVHPDGIVGELKGKSANTKWMGKRLQEYIDKKKIAYDDVIVSVFDGDTRISKEYVGCLVYKYLINTKRTKRSYQPIPLFNNNIWETPFITRTVALGSSFWQMIESCRPYRLINFSSQASSMKTLVDIDFQDETIVSEDSRQFYRVFFKYHGDHKAVPLFTPVFMDAVTGNTFWQTLKFQYYQKRRWAWGMENFPYLVIESIKHKEIPLWERFILINRLFWGTVGWSTASLIIAFAGWMPLLLNNDFRSSILAYNLPIMARNILSVTWLGIFITAFIGFTLLPQRPKRYKRWKYLEMLLQWVVTPVTGILFGSIPALDAQTRMILGGKFRLGFWVTPKKYEERD